MRRSQLWLVGLAVVIRVAALALELQLPYLGHPGLDAAYYHDVGRAFAGGDLTLGREVLHMSPLYSYFVGLVYAVSGAMAWHVIIVQLLLGLGTTCLVHAIARRLFDDERWAFVAGLIAALYGPFVFYELQLMAESVATFVNALLLWLALRASRARSWLLVGIVLGIAALVRPTSLVLGAPLLFAVWPRWRCGLALLFGAALTVSPVTLRNIIVAGEPVLITDSGGLNFFIGNGKGAIGTFRVPKSVPTATKAQAQFAAFRAVAEERVGHPLDARGVDAFWYEQAFSRIRNDPAGWLALLGEKLWLYWNGRELPNTEDYGFHRKLNAVLGLPLPQFVWLSPLALLGTLVWLVRGRRAERLIAAVNVTACAAVVAFFVLGHYRVPAIPGLIIAAVGALRLIVAVPSWRRRAILSAALAAGTVLALAPKLPKSDDDEYWKLGLAYHLDGRLSDAEEAYRNTLALKPDHLGARRNLALLLERSDRRELARAEWQALVESAVRMGNESEAADARAHLRIEP